MKKKETFYEDYVTIKLYKYDKGPRLLCPFRHDNGDTWCDYMYTERCYHCKTSKQDYDEWRKQK